MKKYSVIQSLLLIALAYSVVSLTQCNNPKNKANQPEEQGLDAIADTTVRSIAIFYQMLLPGEMSYLFAKAGAVYTAPLMNDIEHAGNYNSTSQAALNLGVYGVDLGYARMFNQQQATLKYFNTIHTLAKQIAIPEEYFATASRYFERKINDRDTLEAISNAMYSTTYEFLKNNDRPEAASLIILGGWIEALHICAAISKEYPKNKAIVERIASQKYSLNTMISMMGNYRNDPEVATYIMKLKALKKTFDNVNIMFEAGTMEMDTIKKIIHSDNYKVEVRAEDLKEIIKLVESFRSEIIS